MHDALFFDLPNGDEADAGRAGFGACFARRGHAVNTRILVDVARDRLPDGNGTEISVSVRTDTVSLATLTFQNQWLD